MRHPRSRGWGMSGQTAKTAVVGLGARVPMPQHSSWKGVFEIVSSASRKCAAKGFLGRHNHPERTTPFMDAKSSTHVT